MEDTNDILSPRRVAEPVVPGLRKQKTVWIERAKRFKNIDIDVIKHDKWYYINLILVVLSLIVSVFIATNYPPCESNTIPLWVNIIKGIIYSITAVVWVKIQIGIYRHHNPVQIVPITQVGL